MELNTGDMIKRVFVTELELEGGTVNILNTFVENKTKGIFRVQMRTRDEETNIKRFFFDDKVELPIAEYEKLIIVTKEILTKIIKNFPKMKRVIMQIDYIFKATTHEEMIKEIAETGFFGMSGDTKNIKSLARQTDDETTYQSELILQIGKWAEMKGTKDQKLKMLSSFKDSRIKKDLIKHITKK